MVRDLGAKRALLFLVVGFALGAALLGVPWLQHIGAFDQIPYRVTGSTWGRDGQYINYRATFVKDDCTFDRLVVRGVYFGHLDPGPLAWVDVYGDQGDRLEGQQAIALRIGPLSVEYDEIEIRTRHICSGRKVDRVFDRIGLQ